MSNSDDEKRLASWESAQRELRPGETPMERLSFLRSIQKAGWHCGFTRDANEDVVLGAIFPSTPHHAAGSPEAAAEAEAWSQRATEMHSRQQGVELDAKPVERAPLTSGVAVFELVHLDSPTPTFHDTSPASTEVQRRTKRGD